MSLICMVSFFGLIGSIVGGIWHLPFMCELGLTFLVLFIVSWFLYRVTEGQ